jgi:hypothetical protein
MSEQDFEAQQRIDIRPRKEESRIQSVVSDNGGLEIAMKEALTQKKQLLEYSKYFQD